MSASAEAARLQLGTVQQQLANAAAELEKQTKTAEEMKARVNALNANYMTSGAGWGGAACAACAACAVLGVLCVLRVLRVLRALSVLRVLSAASLCHVSSCMPLTSNHHLLLLKPG